MPELADALAAADVRDTAAQLPRDDRAGFWHAMHPVAMHPVAMHPVAMHPVAMHPGAMHPVASASATAPVAPIARTPAYDINAF